MLEVFYQGIPDKGSYPYLVLPGMPCYLATCTGLLPEYYLLNILQFIYYSLKVAWSDTAFV